MSFELNARNIVLASVLVAGLILELLKSFSGSTLIHPNFEDGAAHPYSISERTIRAISHALEAPFKKKVASKPKPFDLTGAIDKWQKDQDKLSAEEKKKKDAAKGWHWAWDSKKQKWVWKKKAKKKTETEVAATATVTPAPTTPSDPSSNSNNNSGTPGSTGLPQPTNNNAPTAGFGASSASRFLSLSEWESLLLGTPNTAETKYFVQQYQDHMVTQEVFYQVVNLMLKDSRPAMEQDGLLALSMTPSSQSFADLAAEQQSLQSNSQLSSTVQTDLGVYSQMTYLSVLSSVLSSSQTAVVLTAAETELQQSISTNLNGTASGSPTAQSTNAQAFAALAPILRTLTTNSNSSVATEAQSLLASIQGNGNSNVARQRQASIE